MKYLLLEQYNLVLIRYGEVWLKSQKVKIRMLKYLMSNIKNMLLHKGIPFHKYQLSKDSSRIFFFFDNKHLSDALKVIQRAFGVHSFSPALRTSNIIRNIADRTIEVAKEILDKNDTFALRVKRSGDHEYSSLDVARIVGQEIIDHFSDYDLKVNLSNPKKKIFIEIRGNFSYIFTHIYETDWGGLPIEPRKNIFVMDVGRIEDLLAGFLLLRRGSKLSPVLFEMSGNRNNRLEDWLRNWKRLIDYIPYKNFRIQLVQFTKIFDQISSKLKQKEFTCAVCRLLRFNILSNIYQKKMFKGSDKTRAISDGLTLNNSNQCTDDVDLNSITLNYLFSNHPIFTPLVSYSNDEINLFRNKISKEFINFEYCQYRPQEQKFDIDKVKEIYRNLAIEKLLEKLPSLIREINLKD